MRGLIKVTLAQNVRGKKRFGSGSATVSGGRLKSVQIGNILPRSPFIRLLSCRDVKREAGSNHVPQCGREFDAVVEVRFVQFLF